MLKTKKNQKKKIKKENLPHKKMKPGIISDDLEVYCFPDEATTKTASYVVAW